MSLSKYRECARLGLAAALFISGCAEALTVPGTPNGGMYCWQTAGEPLACYPTEANRDAVLGARREAERRAATAKESARKDEWIAYQKQRKDDEARGAQERADKLAEWTAARKRHDSSKAAKSDLVHAMALDKEYAGPVISAIMCSVEDEIRGLRASMAHERDSWVSCR